MQNGTVLKRFFEKGFLYGAQRRFFFDDSDNPGSDDTIEKEEHYKWTIALEEETKEYAVIPEEDLLEQAEPEVAERLILKRDLVKRKEVGEVIFRRKRFLFDEMILGKIHRIIGDKFRCGWKCGHQSQKTKTRTVKYHI